MAQAVVVQAVLVQIEVIALVAVEASVLLAV
jgi:hypothetical protein